MTFLYLSVFPGNVQNFQKLYSDPALFFTAWVDLMEKENREFKKSRKRSFKKTAKEAQVSKIATLKKKVHDPKTKRYVMVDLEPQYATLKGARGATPELPLSATLNRKKYGDPQPMAGNFCSLVYSFLEVCLISICYGKVVLVYNNC